MTFEDWWDNHSLLTHHSNKKIVAESAFNAGVLIEREAIIQYLMDQGTIVVSRISEEHVYYIIEDDIEAIRKRT
jgi:hypothetical protein